MAYEIDWEDGDLDWMLRQITWIDVMHKDRHADGYSHDGDLVLPSRSALEFIRDRLTDAQRASLDAWDRAVLAKAADFNRFFADEHHRADPRAACDGYVWEKETGETPKIPPSHWWWRPLSE